MAAGDLWTCPRCGREFANTHQWHSCLEMELEEHLDGHTAEAVALYRAFQSAVETCGEFRIHPQKTRIAFIATMTFAGARLAKRWIDVSFITPRPIDDARIRAIELFGPTSFGHTVRITSASDLDDTVREWLCESWRRGTQETLDSSAQVAVVTGHARAVLSIPLAGRAMRTESGLSLRLPAYAIEALGEGAPVSGRIPGEQPTPARVATPGLVFEGDVLERLGLGDGDPVDVFVKPT